MTREPKNPSTQEPELQLSGAVQPMHNSIFRFTPSDRTCQGFNCILHVTLYMQEPSTIPQHPNHPLNQPLPCLHNNPNPDNTLSTLITNPNNPSNNPMRLTCLKVTLKYWQVPLTELS